MGTSIVFTSPFPFPFPMLSIHSSMIPLCPSPLSLVHTTFLADPSSSTSLPPGSHPTPTLTRAFSSQQIPMVAPFFGCTFGGWLYDMFLYTGESPINTEAAGLARFGKLNRQTWSNTYIPPKDEARGGGVKV